MKRVLINCLGVFFSLTFLSVGCEDMNDSVTIVLVNEFTETIHVEIVSDEEVTITEVLDAATEQDISDNLAKIESYEIEALKIEIVNIVTDSEDEVILEGSVGAGSLSSLVPETILIENTVPLTMVDEVVEMFVFDPNLDAQIIDPLIDLLEADNGIKFYMTGSASAPVSFDVIVTAKVKTIVGV
jgi:hypothetical protein